MSWNAVEMKMEEGEPGVLNEGEPIAPDDDRAKVPSNPPVCGAEDTVWRCTNGRGVVGLGELDLLRLLSRP
jgi:hypothetical protein